QTHCGSLAIVALHAATLVVYLLVATVQSRLVSSSFFFFFTDPATTAIYTLSLHDALPIFVVVAARGRAVAEPYRGQPGMLGMASDRKSTRLNSSHVKISYAVFCLKKKKKK